MCLAMFTDRMNSCQTVGTNSELSEYVKTANIIVDGALFDHLQDIQ